MNENEILYLLKHGRNEDVQAYLNTVTKEAYSEDFPQFMEEMIQKYKIKRKDIALRSGLSQDYTYKLLRGDKRTTERDYILAICIAIGMSLSETQHALRIYGMPTLQNTDTRSHIIALGISQGCNIDQLDEWLEKAGCYLIKTSPDMPSARITPVLSDEADVHHYEEISRSINAEHDGQAPMDYDYWGIIKVKDEDGNIYYVEGAYTNAGDTFDVLTEEMHDRFCAQSREEDAFLEKLQNEVGDDIYDPEKLMNNPKFDALSAEYKESTEGIEPLEKYHSLLDAARSPFFKWYLEIDKATDDKVQEVMAKVDDTRNYGVRYGAKVGGNGFIYYMEAFNSQQPERREYFQIVQDGDHYTYTASHQSYYMQMELDKLYPVYFGENPAAPEYFINVDDLFKLNQYQLRYRFIFSDLRLSMHEYMHDYIGVKISEQELDQERIESLTQRATMYNHGEDYAQEAAVLEEAYAIMKRETELGNDKLPSMIVTCWKLAGVYLTLGDAEKEEKWEDECLSYNDRLNEALKDPDTADNLGDAPLCMADIYLDVTVRYQREGDTEAEKKALLQAIALYDGRCNNTRSWGSYVRSLTLYAFQIDEEDPEGSLRYTRKAMDIVRDQGLDREPDYQEMVWALFNNHAWVLWNRLSSEEAVIYYARAIDLIEGALATGTEYPEKAREALAKEGKRLYTIYEDTGKSKEAERLRKHLSDEGIDISQVQE